MPLSERVHFKIVYIILSGLRHAYIFYTLLFHSPVAVLYSAAIIQINDILIFYIFVTRIIE